MHSQVLRLCKCAGAVLVLAAFSGCATYACRGERAGLHGAYPAARLDVGFFDFMRHEGKDSWLLPPVVGLGVALDLPFSVVTDTLFLPFDLRRNNPSGGGATEEPAEMNEPAGQPAGDG